MSRTAIEDIQQALNLIRIEADRADWQTRMEVLQLMLAASNSIVANAKMLSEPRPKPTRKPVKISRPLKTISSSPKAARKQPAKSKTSASKAKDGLRGPQKPIPPLDNQQLRNRPPK